MPQIIPPPWWRPDSFERRRPMLNKRRDILKAVRGFFESEEFDEVETPALQVSPGNEVHLHAFSTLFTDFLTGVSKSFHLHTSPEFSMKKLLVAGMPKIFQIAHVYRNGERSSRHHPEFSMLEWYRTGANLQTIMEDCISLVRIAAKTSDKKKFEAQGMACDPFKSWETLSVPDAFMRYADIDLMPLLNSVDKFGEALRSKNIRVTEKDGWDDLFFRVMGEKIEPFLGKDRPTFLCDYPVSMAALARPKAKDPRLAERFELFICGYELANAFDELTDAKEQRRRFEADMLLKDQLYKNAYPIDEDFMDALEHGMPPSAGIALGFDRLVMLCAGTENIEDILWAPMAG